MMELNRKAFFALAALALVVFTDAFVRLWSGL